MNSQEVGKFISERRKLMNLTQQELANRLGVTNKAVSRWETGEGYPDITMITDLANCLCVTTDELLSSEVKLNSNSHAHNENCAENKGDIICVNDKNGGISPHFHLTKSKGDVGKRKIFNTALAATLAFAIILTSAISSIFHVPAETSTAEYESKLSKFEEKLSKDYSWNLYKLWPR